MADDDKDYCLRRAAEERKLAGSTKDPDGARRHAALADLFELRATDPAAWAKLSTQDSSQPLL